MAIIKMAVIKISSFTCSEKQKEKVRKHNQPNMTNLQKRKPLIKPSYNPHYQFLHGLFFNKRR